MILVGFYFSISFWACCWGFSILDPYYYRRLVNGRMGKTIMRFPYLETQGWEKNARRWMRFAGSSQLTGGREGETRELIVDTAYPTRSGCDFSWSGRSPNQELAAQQMLLVMGIMCSNPRQEGWCYRWRIASRVGQDEAGTGCHGCIDRLGGCPKIWYV